MDVCGQSRPISASAWSSSVVNLAAAVVSSVLLVGVHTVAAGQARPSGSEPLSGSGLRHVALGPSAGSGSEHLLHLAGETFSHAPILLSTTWLAIGPEHCSRSAHCAPLQENSWP